MEDRDTKIRRLYMRSIRRGIKEMDLILGKFGKDILPTLSDTDLEVYDEMLSVNDHDLYAWVTGNVAADPEYKDMIDRVTAHYSE